MTLCATPSSKTTLSLYSVFLAANIALVTTCLTLDLSLQNFCFMLIFNLSHYGQLHVPCCLHETNGNKEELFCCYIHNTQLFDIFL